MRAAPVGQVAASFQPLGRSIRILSTLARPLISSPPPNPMSTPTPPPPQSHPPSSRPLLNPPFPSLPPISHSPQTPVDPTAPYRFWRSISSPRFVVAPMVNQSELPFRLLCRSFGAQLTYTPMLHSTLFSRDPKYRAKHFHTHPTDRPLFAQFCGDDPLTLLSAARHIQHQVDAIDINLGCPQGIARRGHYGAFLLSEPQLIRSIVSTLHDHLQIPVTCKIRCLPTVDETLALAKVIQDAGCSVLTVHGRTKECLKDKTGPADWEMIRRVKAHLTIPVIANGGIGCYDDVMRCLEYTGCDGVMTSEAILESPHIFHPTLTPSPYTLARLYLTLTTQHPHPPSTIRPHLFKLLFRPLSVHTDVRERFGRVGVEELDGLIGEMERREEEWGEEERGLRYEGKFSWYERHKGYKGARVGVGKEGEEGEGRKRGREEEERKEGAVVVEGDKRQRGDVESVRTELMIDAEQKREDVKNGEVGPDVKAKVEKEVRSEWDECEGGVCKIIPSEAMLEARMSS